ncbi:MAG: SDR family NAD(P)-dependent oxidoreductase [Hyphomicrobiales bacterium]
MFDSATYINGLYSLDGRVALVTGASSGIGRHIALTLANAGAKVVVVARRKETLAEISRSGQIAAHPVDLMEVEDFEGFGNSVSNHFGPATILVNAAGINLRQTAVDVTRQGWDQTLHLNLSVPFFLARALVPAMMELGAGNIINIASLQSYRAFKDGIAYGASKGGIAQLTRAMAQAWSRDGIVANAVAPGFFPTELTQAVFDDPETSTFHANATAIGRNGEMTDLDGAVVFLASRSASYVTGQVLAVDGGYLAT